MAVKEWNDEIIFVRQVTPGASERSFGIQVARLAGLPDSVVGRAKEILAGLETGSVVSESHKEEIPRDDEPISISGADSSNEIQANQESENTKNRSV